MRDDPGGGSKSLAHEDSGTVWVRGMRMIPADQAWFWSAEWQQNEREASAAIATGRVTRDVEASSFLNSFDG